MVTAASIEAVAVIVAEAIAASIEAAVAAGASELVISGFTAGLADSATEAVTAAITPIIEELVEVGITREVANMISTYLISPTMSLGAITLQEFVDDFIARGLAYVADFFPGGLLLQTTKAGQEPLSATKEEKEYWDGLMDKAKEVVLKKARPGVQSYIQNGYKTALEAAKAENEKWLKKQKKDIMLKSLIPIYGQVQAGIRLSHLKADAMKQFHSAANSHLNTFLHSQECREKWGKSFQAESEKFLESDEWKKMVQDWMQQHPNNPDNILTTEQANKPCWCD